MWQLGKEATCSLTELKKDSNESWHPGGLGEASEGWVKKGISGGQGTQVCPCLCRSLPFPFGVLRKLCGLAAIKLQWL